MSLSTSCKLWRLVILSIEAIMCLHSRYALLCRHDGDSLDQILGVFTESTLSSGMYLATVNALLRLPIYIPPRTTILNTCMELRTVEDFQCFGHVSAFKDCTAC